MEQALSPRQQSSRTTKRAKKQVRQRWMFEQPAGSRQWRCVGTAHLGGCIGRQLDMHTSASGYASS